VLSYLAGERQHTPLLLFFRAIPAAFVDRMQTMLNNYLKACEALGRAPDAKPVTVAQDSILRCSCACDKATFQRAIQ
jgi:hypothetical protein